MKKRFFVPGQFIRKEKRLPQKREPFILFQENRKQQFEEHRSSSKALPHSLFI